jgi:hypothetical protein
MAASTPIGPARKSWYVGRPARARRSAPQHVIEPIEGGARRTMSFGWRLEVGAEALTAQTVGDVLLETSRTFLPGQDTTASGGRHGDLPVQAKRVTDEMFSGAGHRWRTKCRRTGQIRHTSHRSWSPGCSPAAGQRQLAKILTGMQIAESLSRAYMEPMRKGCVQLIPRGHIHRKTIRCSTSVEDLVVSDTTWPMARSS